MKESIQIHKGYVELYGVHLSDSDIVEIARVSTGSGARGEDDDRPFIDYLFRHEHLSPFGFPQMTFKIKAPIFVARQLFRHRMAQVNEMSGRYTEMPKDMFLPEVKRIRKQGKDNRQGSGPSLDAVDAKEIQDSLAENQDVLLESYEEYLGRGVSKEVARINLPLSQYTVFYWQQDLRNLLHMIKLRIDPHAQPEIQEYGRAMFQFAKASFPWSVAAFEKHVIHGRRFHQGELQILRELVESNDGLEWIKARTEGWKKSHVREFLDKLR